MASGQVDSGTVHSALCTGRQALGGKPPRLDPAALTAPVTRRRVAISVVATAVALVPFGLVTANAGTRGFTATASVTVQGRAAATFPVAKLAPSPTTAAVATQPAAPTTLPTPDPGKEESTSTVEPKGRPSSRPATSRTAEPEPTGTTTAPTEPATTPSEDAK